MLSHDDYSDFYPDILDNPVKHMRDVLDAIDGGRKDIFDALLSKINDHPKVACVAYQKQGLEWSQTVVANHPNDNYISYIELLLKDAFKPLDEQALQDTATLVSHAFDVWETTPSALSANSCVFDLYQNFNASQKDTIRGFAIEHFNHLQLLRAATVSFEFEFVRAAIAQSKEILFPRQILAHLIVNEPEHLEELWRELPRTREQSFHQIYDLLGHDGQRLSAMQQLIPLYGDELKTISGCDFNHVLASEIDRHHNDMAKVLSIFYSPEYENCFCLVVAAGSTGQPNSEMFDLLYENTTIEQAQHAFNSLSANMQQQCFLLSDRIANAALKVTLHETLNKQRQTNDAPKNISRKM